MAKHCEAGDEHRGRSRRWPDSIAPGPNASQGRARRGEHKPDSVFYQVSSFILVASVLFVLLVITNGIACRRSAQSADRRTAPG
jgi:hypothetical protein